MSGSPRPSDKKEPTFAIVDGGTNEFQLAIRDRGAGNRRRLTWGVPQTRGGALAEWIDAQTARVPALPVLLLQRPAVVVVCK
ncbi:hypothetical protein CTAM01_03957 [Colletotrichum tamarilloi]|uniref:Uncharacterized protein n=1 Tax=Colletotrichum tamarilloi TaxID=1209934 RepID=A0ABQ9RJJ4_9PEZI|nr:uncharacterized protein CTAM01_03957 [Colletotrichum tamarilloi]KAK1504650.1 hypothetical protein CTAM01_03957 [Colletotrichum tamarilloi]